MCPEQQLLSVYFDGELPSPWNEKMSAHIAICRKCADMLEEFRICSEALREKTEPSLEKAKERVFQNLVPYFDRHKPSLWRRTVSLPLPVAAAAAVVFALAFLFALIHPFAPAQPSSQSMAAVENSMEMDVQNIVPASDIDGVLQYLGAQNGSEYMIIKLPETKNFTSTGDPMIIKAADYTRRVGSR